MKLTRLEQEILRHRLSVPECIAEALDADARGFQVDKWGEDHFKAWAE